MPSPSDVAKRFFVGRPLRSDRLGETELPKKLALPVFASDALSSVAYATEEILIMLSVAGLTFYHFTPYLAGCVVLLMLVVVASYRQNVHAYPSGGGDYEVANTNLGPTAGLTVASALLVDYVLTVAVSSSAGVANVVSAVPALAGHEVALTLGVVLLITVMNLRGVRESGTAFAIPTYAFILGVAVMIGWGLLQLVTGHPLRASSAGYTIHSDNTFTGLAVVYLAMRAFASGCTALTGVEAISNGVPAFKKPKSKNAATTLALMGAIAVSMFVGVTVLALATHVHVVDPQSMRNLVGANGAPQKTVIAQIGSAVFGGDSSLGFLYVQTVTALILVLAANTAFNGFPVLASILAQDRYLPRQLHNRGDRLVYSNGVLMLAGVAAVLIYAFRASPTKLIQLYIVGVFVSFVCSQTGMVRHWTRLLRTERDAAARRRMMRSRVINAIGAGCTATVLVIVLLTKFVHGAWIVVVAMPVIFLVMRSIRRHYDNVSVELSPDDTDPLLPSRNHAVVLVSKIHKPTLRALAYARATRPSSMVAVTVTVDESETRALQGEWERRDIPVPLIALDSPYREISRPVLDYVKNIRRESPRDVVTVYVPEYVVGHWWEHILHNQSALRLKSRLLFQPGVMVTSVPWQLTSSRRAAARPGRPNPPGGVRGPGPDRGPSVPVPAGTAAPREPAGAAAVPEPNAWPRPRRT